MTTKHVQLSIEAARWPDDMLDGILTEDGKPMSAAEVRDYLREIKTAGLEVVPCHSCVCDAQGRCTGERRGS